MRLKSFGIITCNLDKQKDIFVKYCIIGDEFLRLPRILIGIKIKLLLYQMYFHFSDCA